MGSTSSRLLLPDQEHVEWSALQGEAWERFTAIYFNPTNHLAFVYLVAGWSVPWSAATLPCSLPVHVSYINAQRRLLWGRWGGVATFLGLGHMLKRSGEHTSMC